jgi:uncharacterized protein with PhoU and TrkA domain
MIDLAYSSVLFNDRELAEEVMNLYESVERFQSLLQMNVAVAVRNAEEAEEMLGIMKLGVFTETISETAADIAHIVFLGLATDPSVTDALSNVRERIVKTIITRESILIGKKLSMLKFEANIGVNVMAVRREGELIANPKQKFILRNGDTLIARGSDVGIFELDKLASGELRAVPTPTLDVKEAHQ